MKKLIAVLIFILNAIPGQCAVVFDAVGTVKDSGGGGINSPQTTNNIVVGAGANRALIAIFCSFVGGPTVTSVVWDAASANQAMTLIKSAADNSANTHTCSMWGLVNPTSKTSAVTINYTGTLTELISQTVSWTGVDQTGGTTSFPNSDSATGNSNAASLTLTSVAGNATVSAIATGDAFALNSVSATQTYLAHGAGFIESGGSRAAGAASVVMTGAIAGTDQWVVVGTDIQASAASAPAPQMYKSMIRSGVLR